MIVKHALANRDDHFSDTCSECDVKGKRNGVKNVESTTACAIVCLLQDF